MDSILGAAITVLVLLGANGFAIKWLKGSVDDLRKEHDDLIMDVAKNYSSSDKTIQMIGLVNAPVQQAIDSLKSEVHETKGSIKSIERKIDTILLNQGKK